MITVAERECGPAADGGWRCAPYAECTHPGGCLLGDLADPAPADDRGPVVPIAADPERDARREIYRDRERRRAARALDRYVQSLDYGEEGQPQFGARSIDVAGERFVEAVGDYVLARIAGDADALEGAARALRARDLHQKADYGVPGPVHLHVWQAGRCVAAGGGPGCVADPPAPPIPDLPGWDPTGALADMCSQLPGCRPGTDGKHSASCEVSIYRLDNPCADGQCPDPVMHAEGGHDV